MSRWSFLCFLSLIFFLAGLQRLHAQDDFLGDRYCAFDFVSSMNFAASENFTTIVSPSLAKYSGNPLFGQDKPWETRIDNGYPNVVYTPDHADASKVYQLWYDDFLGDGLEGTLYAKSRDGLHWLKAVLNINSWHGSTENNIMFMDSAGVGIFRDRYESDPAQVYKAFGQLPGMPNHNGGLGNGGIASSPNGINSWSPFRMLRINHTQYQKWDTHNNMFFDVGKTNRYVGITRVVNPRMVGRSPATVPSPQFIDTQFAQAEVVESGGDDNQTYAQITFRYYNVYLGLVMIFASSTPEQRVFCQLAWSPDSITWYRIQGNVQELIPLSPIDSNAFDSHICFTAAYPVVDRTSDGGNSVRLYYFGGNGPHGGARNSSFALARIRIDGFAGVTNASPHETALMRSFAIRVEGDFLFVNMDVIASQSGSARIGFQNVNGFAVGDCLPITSNVTNSIVSWKGGQSLSSLLGTQVVIEFELHHAVLYTFGFQNGSNATAHATAI